MLKKSQKRTVIAISALVLIGFGALVVHNYKTKTSLKYNEENTAAIKPQENPQDAVAAAVNDDAAAIAETRKNSDLLKASSSDFVLGDKKASVLMIEYASLSCPHCAAFARESFDKFKTEYVDSGKVQFIFRNFPLNQSALSAAMFAQCQAQDNKSELPDRYFQTIKALFKTQDSWAFDEKYNDKLEAIAKLDGMSSERFKACIEDKSLQEKILVSRMDAAKVLKLKSTPSFFVNGEIAEGYVDYQTLKKLLDKKLAEANK